MMDPNDAPRPIDRRDFLKTAAASVQLLFLLAYVMPALGGLSAVTGPGKWTRVLANAVVVLAVSALCFTIFAVVAWLRRYPEDRKEAAGVVFWPEGPVN